MRNKKGSGQGLQDNQWSCYSSPQPEPSLYFFTQFWKNKKEEGDEEEEEEEEDEEKEEVAWWQQQHQT